MINEVKNSCLEINNGVIQLKRKHDFYYQVQGVMHVANLKWAHFVVYTTKDFYVEESKYEANFMKEALLNLNSI